MTRSSIEVRPRPNAEVPCHDCGRKVAASNVLWVGFHVCAEFQCQGCGAHFVEDLSVGHAVSNQFRVDFRRWLLLGSETGRDWFGEPLLRALQSPDNAAIDLKVEVRRKASRVVVLNCVDVLYGHALLKLLNAAHHLDSPDYALIVIVQPFLRWMVPKGVAEVWTADVPLGRAHEYFPELSKAIERELDRFGEARVSRAFSHPRRFRLEDFTQVPKHDFAAGEYRVTFIWRSDRLWLPENLLVRAVRRLGLKSLLLGIQRHKIQSLLKNVKRALPAARPTIAGLGRQGRFPSWIEDCRADRLTDEEAERAQCRIYAESRVVLGVHGSNMLLPSGHAGMCVDLMPPSRWPNVAQDMLIAQGDHDADARMNSYRYRFIPLATAPAEVGGMVAGMVRGFDWVVGRFVGEMREQMESAPARGLADT